MRGLRSVPAASPLPVPAVLWKPCLLIGAVLGPLAAGAQPGPVGGDRPAAVQVPSSYDPAVPAPLLLLLHGFGSNPDYIEPYLLFGPVAEARGIIVARPHGTFDRSGLAFWNATDACCAFGDRERQVDDSGYLASLIEEIRGRWNVDPDRIFIVGHSNGGFMSYRMACDHADVVAGIASLAGATFGTAESCRPAAPVHVLQVHGSADDTIRYGGGTFNGGAVYPGALSTAQQWAGHDGCSLEGERLEERLDLDGSLAGAETSITRFASGCASGGSVELWTIQGGSHSPGFPRVGDATTFSVHVTDWLLGHPKRPSPVADFSVLPAVGPAPLTVSADASASLAPEGASIASYRWSLGDGASAEGVSVTHTFTDPGRYVLRLATLTADGRVSEWVQRIVTVQCAGGETAPWIAADIGEPSFPGTAARGAGGGFELCAGGATGATSPQSLFFLHQEASGDFQVTAHIGELPLERVIEVGVQLRGGLEPGAPLAEMLIRTQRTGRRFRFLFRDEPDGRPRSRAGSMLPGSDGWVRIAKEGDIVRGYGSADGQTWSLEDEAVVPLADGYLAGLAVSADDREPAASFTPLRVAVPVLELAPTSSSPAFIRGDCNGDGAVSGNVSDVLFHLRFSFADGPAPVCLAACDADGDGAATGNVTDAVYLLAFNFLGGPPPPPPFPACGPGALATDAALGCDETQRSCAAGE